MYNGLTTYEIDNIGRFIEETEKLHQPIVVTYTYELLK